MIEVEKQDKINFQKFALNNYKLSNIRIDFPQIHLFENALIGTEDIRQFIYCKRIIYFRYILKAPMIRTYKMDLGMKKHEELQKLANKNKDVIQKYYNIYLTDPQCGLVGLIDYFEFDGKEAYPVEIKSGKIPPDGLENSHKYQVTAQAVLIEKNFDFLVNKIRIFYSKFKKMCDYPIKIEDKLAVLEAIRKIQKLINQEILPSPTEDRGKCVDCECKNYCLSI